MACRRLLAVAAVARVAAGAVSSGCGVESTDILEYVGMESLPLALDGHNHILTLPQDYDYETPVPLILYMHGWGGDASEGDAFASTARKKGIATAALEGSGPENWQSWNAGGSSSSPGPRGATCKPGSTDYCSYYAETCECENSDGCWWTTCEDSTRVLLDALEAVEKMLCVDLEQVWVAGCSNGAMMVYEALADSRSAGLFAGGVSIVGAPHPGFWRPPSSSAHLLGIWGLSDTTIPYEASEDAPGPGVALATVDEDDERGWYYTAARNVTRAWSLHHGGPAAPVATNAYGNGDVSCSTFVGASRETVECTVKAGHVCGRADEIETALGFIEGRRGTSSDKSSSSTSDAKVATAAAVAVVVTCVLLAVFIVSFLFYRRRSRSRGIFELVDVSPVNTLAAPGIAAPSVVGKRPTPSPLRGSPPPRALRPTGALLTPPREGGGGEFPS
ncbi:unnamed protein product [Pelagomonas calceolata]|uniref:Feruloyl esterase n=1 Tax=Pelagomonas calceolata TaxID=35677 RepID=A0A8J2ST43_9STRA|nr:unnamed protein product [Pelagomonas calceolata]